MRVGPRNLNSVLAATIFVAALASRSVAHFLHIQDPKVDRATFGRNFSGPPIIVLGSSLTFFDISFSQVAEAARNPIEVRSVGAASPCELEPLQKEVTNPKLTLIGVSIFDLNEQNLSPAKPLLVPFVRSALDLAESNSSWRQSKRLLSAYPVQWVRYLFPTAGRSPEVIFGARDFLAAKTHRTAPDDAPPKMQLTGEDVARPEKITDWSEARLLRRVAALRVSGMDENSFAGPKSKALGRILRRAFDGQGEARLVVLPVSPPYHREFVNATSAALFESALQRLRDEFPKLTVMRLDTAPELNEPAVFWDLVHLNDEGRRIATPLLIEQFN